METHLKSVLLRSGIPFAIGLAVGLLAMHPKSTPPQTDGDGTPMEEITADSLDDILKAFEAANTNTPNSVSTVTDSVSTIIETASFVETRSSSFRPLLKLRLGGVLPSSANRKAAESNLLARTTVKGPDDSVIPFTVTDSFEGNSYLLLQAASDCPDGIYTVEVEQGVDLGDGISIGKPYRNIVPYRPSPNRPIYLAASVESFSGKATLFLNLEKEIPGDAPEDYLEIDPPVRNLVVKKERFWGDNRTRVWRLNEQTSYWHGEACYGVSGSFESGKEYTIRLRGGAPGQAPRILTDPTPVSFRIPKPDPSVEFTSRGTALATVGRRGVAIRSRGLPELRVEVSRILPQNIPEFLHRKTVGADGVIPDRGDDDYWDYYYGDSHRKADAEDLADPVGTRSIAIGRVPLCDMVSTNIVALDDFAAEERLPSGVYLIECGGYDPDKDEDIGGKCRRVVALSDIGLTARRIGKSVHVWATRLSKASPIAGATLEAYAPNNKLLATARTDAAGLGELAVGSGDTSFVLAKTDSGEYAYITLNGDFALDELPSRPKEAFPADAKSLSGFLFSNRGIYRHGESVPLQGLVRAASGTAPEPLPLTLEVRRPDDRLVDTISVKTDAKGFFAIPGGKGWTIPDGQPSGKWSAILRTPGKNGQKIASYGFSVEEFVPPQIQVKTVDFPEVVPAWRSIASNAKADYFFGSPAAKLSAEALYTFSFEPFRPVGYPKEAWQFGVEKDLYTPQTYWDEGTTETNGTISLFCPFTPKLADSSEAVRVDVETTVTEPGGRPVTDRARGTIHPWTAYLGLEKSSVEPGKNLRTGLRLVAPDGAVATNTIQGLKATLTAIHHHYEYSRNDRGWWDWNDRIREKELQSFTFDLEAGETNLVFEIPTLEGDYRISVDPPEELTALPSAKGTFEGTNFFRVAPVRWTFGAWGRDGKTAALAGPVRLQVTPNADTYAPGDVAHLDVRAPFEGLALVTVQRDHVISQELVTLTNGTATIDVPVTAELAPNFEVAVSCIRPVQAEATWGEHRAYGAVSILVKDPARILPVQVAIPTVEIRPVGSRVTVDVSGGAPGAHATVFLVDEAVLGLTGFKTPVPDSVFSRAFWSGAKLFDTFVALMRIEEGPYAKSAAIGGDEGTLLRRRTSPVKSRRFQPLALAQTDLVFENGSLRAVFDLPEFSGSVRAFAVAWTDRSTGSAEASAKIAPKVVLQPDAARFLAPGDESEITGTLHNTTKAPLNLVWTCTVGGNGIAKPLSGAPIAGSLTLPAGGSYTIRVPIRVETIPAGTELPVEFSVKTAEETRSAKLLIPVRPAFANQKIASFRILEAGATATLDPPSALLPGTLETELAADPSPFAKYAPALEWLDAYPWGCLEQTTSRALPLLYAQKANAALLDVSPATVDSRINQAIAIIAGRMGPGTFFVWDDCFWNDPGYSAYAGFFLAEAESAGYDLPAPLKTGYRHILRDLAGNVSFEPEVRTLAVLALETAGSPVRDWEQNLFDRRKQLSALAAYRLSLALRKAGQPEQAAELLLAAEPKAKATDCAWGILAWLASGLPETNERVSVLENMLLSTRRWNGHWGSTSDNAAALLASAAQIRRLGTGTGDSARIVLYDADRATLTATGKLARATTDLQGSFIVSNAGPSRVFLNVIASGFPATNSVRAAAHGVSVERRYYTRDHKPIDPTRGIPVGETVIAELRIVPAGGADVELGNVVVEDLFPAGLEPRIGAKTPNCDWIEAAANVWVDHAEVRDDRLVLFAKSVKGPKSYFYAMAAVSAGSYVVPPVQTECMYQPAINGVSQSGTIRVLPRTEIP